jgi:nickel-dependent lactate racemase
MRLEVPYGKTTLSFNIPEPQSVEIILPKEPPFTSDSKTLIQKALQNPIGQERLGNIVQPADIISIIVSDSTRPIPTAMMLPPLINNLLMCNVNKENIRIIFGLGIHRKQTEEEKITIVGQNIYQEYQCLDHDNEHCSYLGTTRRGTPVEVFKPVVESDVVICTGSIEHHYFAGYTGGYKAVVPGVSSQRSIAANHALMIEPGTAPGNLECPVRSDLEEAGNILGVELILNVILNSKKEIVGAVAGHPIDAHRMGARMMDDMNRREVEPADIVIVSPGGWPKDINVFQSHKALENVKSAVKPGGTIIMAAQCSEGIGNKVYEQWLDTTSGPQEVIERFNRQFVQGGHKAALMAKLASMYDLYLVSDMLPEVAQKAYFNPVSSIQEAFETAAARYGREARVLVVPYGGSTLVVHTLDV